MRSGEASAKPRACASRPRGCAFWSWLHAMSGCGVAPALRAAINRRCVDVFHAPVERPLDDRHRDVFAPRLLPRGSTSRAENARFVSSLAEIARGHCLCLRSGRRWREAALAIGGKRSRAEHRGGLQRAVVRRRRCSLAFIISFMSAAGRISKIWPYFSAGCCAINCTA